MAQFATHWKNDINSRAKNSLQLVVATATKWRKEILFRIFLAIIPLFVIVSMSNAFLAWAQKKSWLAAGQSESENQHSIGNELKTLPHHCDCKCNEFPFNSEERRREAGVKSSGRWNKKKLTIEKRLFLINNTAAVQLSRWHSKLTRFYAWTIKGINFNSSQLSLFNSDSSI